ncbi:MAG: hypothetical protein ABF289_03790, partial [Clostridiales bacterium]
HILKFGNKYDIYNIVLSRFELISAIMYEENKKLIKNNIVIIGAGNLGFSCLIHLLDKGIKDITLVKNRDTFFLKNAIRILEDEYDLNIITLNKIEKYDYNVYIDSTGKKEIITEIIEKSKEYAKVILLGTPREPNCKVDLLIIHRKSLKLIGAHEICGVNEVYRNQLLIKLLEKNKNKKSYIKQFVNIYKYSIEQIKGILKEKNNIFEVLKYDL